MNISVRITLPEAPHENLAERISIAGFTSPYADELHFETEYKNMKQHFADVLVSDGIIPPERRGDLLFDFG